MFDTDSAEVGGRGTAANNELVSEYALCPDNPVGWSSLF